MGDSSPVSPAVSDATGPISPSAPPTVTCPYCDRPATVRLEPTEGGGAEWVATCSPCHEHLGALQ